MKVCEGVWQHCRHRLAEQGLQISTSRRRGLACRLRSLGPQLPGNLLTKHMASPQGSCCFAWLLIADRTKAGLPNALHLDAAAGHNVSQAFFGGELHNAQEAARLFRDPGSDKRCSLNLPYAFGKLGGYAVCALCPAGCPCLPATQAQSRVARMNKGAQLARATLVLHAKRRGPLDRIRCTTFNTRWQL